MPNIDKITLKGTDYTIVDSTVPSWAKASTKPTYTASEISGLANVATSGSYNDLTDKPNIPDIDDAKPLVVTIVIRFSDNDTTYSLDNVTFNQMVAAYNAGKDLILCDYDGLIYQLSYSDAPDRFIFTSFQGDEGSYSCFEISGDNAITRYGGAVVPTTRTVNGKTLSSNITLSASDVGALPSNTHIPADQVQSNWNETNTSSKAYIQNKPTLADVATSGSYNDLQDKPTIPAAYDDTALATRVTVLEGQTHNVTYNQSTTTLTIQ